MRLKDFIESPKKSVTRINKIKEKNKVNKIEQKYNKNYNTTRNIKYYITIFLVASNK